MGLGLTVMQDENADIKRLDHHIPLFATRSTCVTNACGCQMLKPQHQISGLRIHTELSGSPIPAFCLLATSWVAIGELASDKIHQAILVTSMHREQF